MSKLRNCFCCEKAYHYCPNCSRDKNKPSWYFIFDSKNCRDIFDICQKYSTNTYTAKEAKAKLDKCDLTNKDKFRSDIKKVIEQIFAECSKKTETSASSFSRQGMKASFTNGEKKNKNS